MENKDKSLFGLIHAGWRGMEKQLIYLSLGKMLEHFLSSLESLETFQIHCFCGPCAGAQRYIVGPELVPYFHPEALARRASQRKMERAYRLCFWI